MGRALSELRATLPPNGIVFTSSGNVQAQVFQEMPFTQPRTYISAGGFSTMGWAFPAAMGAKLAAPDAPVVALAGDGDFLMTIQELATAVQYNIPVVTVVLNNLGWQAIRDLQTLAYGEESVYATMFESDHEAITPHIADAARAFGAHAVRICRPDEVGPALSHALRLNRPSVIEIMVDTTLGTSGGLAPGWWDVPVPCYLTERRRHEQNAAARVTESERAPSSRSLFCDLRSRQIRLDVLEMVYRRKAGHLAGRFPALDPGCALLPPAKIDHRPDWPRATLLAQQGARGGGAVLVLARRASFAGRPGTGATSARTCKMPGSDQNTRRGSRPGWGTGYGRRGTGARATAEAAYHLRSDERGCMQSGVAWGRLLRQYRTSN